METTPAPTPDAPRWNPYSADCPTRVVLDRIADKWTVLILGLLGDGPRRFNQLRKSVNGLSQKVLTQILRGLETDGLVTRTAFPTVPVTVEYELTPLGHSLRETLDGVRLWAEANIEAILEARKAKGI